MQRKCRIDWGTGITWFPNLYVILVGPSATGKGTAMGPGLQLLRDLGNIKLSSNATSLQALIRRLKDSNVNDPDLTSGKMQLHSSLTIFSKEFTVFLGYHNRELMAALCDWYDCDDLWSYETISRKKEEVIGVWVNMIGGTTPDLIRSALPIDAIGGGLSSRIIYVFEKNKEKDVSQPMQSTAELELYEMLLTDLSKISLLSGSFRYTKGFLSAWDAWSRSCSKNPPFDDPKLDGYLGRRRAHTMKLAMIVSASHGQNEMILTEDDLINAIALLKEAETNMPLVFRGVGKSSTADLIHRSIEFFERSTIPDVPVYQFANYFKDDMDKPMMERILATLEAMKYAKVVHKPGADAVIRILDFKRKEKSHE